MVLQTVLVKKHENILIVRATYSDAHEFTSLNVHERTTGVAKDATQLEIRRACTCKTRADLLINSLHRVVLRKNLFSEEVERWV